jgi:hypothetical protein
MSARATRSVRVATRHGAQVCGHAVEVGIGQVAADAVERVAHARRGAAGHHHACASAGQAARDGQADAGGGAAHHGHFAVEVDVHGCLSVGLGARWKKRRSVPLCRRSRKTGTCHIAYAVIA